MPSRPYAQYTRPEQSNPLAGEMPPQLYGTPTALSAMLAARSPRVGLGFGMRVGARSLGDVGTCRLTLGGSSLVRPGRSAGEDHRGKGERKQSSAEKVRHSGEGNDGPLKNDAAAALACSVHRTLAGNPTLSTPVPWI